jgi:hypothetical protein
MPLMRYLTYVGGVLLALLFVADILLSKLPLRASTEPHLQPIRIASERKWPEPVVFDTSIRVDAPARPADLPAAPPVPAVPADVSAHARNALAQLQSPAAGEARASDRKKRGPKPQRQFNLARKSSAPVINLARHPQFGWFGYGIW